MAISLGKRIENEGLSREWCRDFIRSNGLVKFCDRAGCGYDTGRRYALEELELPEGELVPRRAFQTKQDVAFELISAVFEKWEKIKAENEELKAEIAEMRNAENLREEIAKVQLSRMLDVVKV